jgi:outer membrane lipoprotein carrier protein
MRAAPIVLAGTPAALLIVALVLALVVAAAPPAFAAAAPSDQAGNNALERYLTGLNTLSATFRQTVTNAEGVQTEAGGGKLLVQRPGRFRWEYTPVATGASNSGSDSGSDSGSNQRGQVLVADGRNLWFYDRELAQVTVKPVEAALSATPIVLLSGSSSELRSSFEIAAGSAHEGLDWVEVKPRSAEADFAVAQLGFKGDKLVRMIVKDRLGQTVELEFSRSERNPRLDAAALKFQPPPGADVIGAPQG